jgi:hypothetical protein
MGVATSDVAICNLALDAAHCRSSISAIGENSAEGQACARHYEQAKEAVLRAAHWNFARKQINLALLNDATLTPPQPVPQPWMYEYAYPSDCVLAYGVLPQMTNPAGASINGDWQPPQPQMPMARFIVAQDNDVTGNAIPVILTNVPQAQLVYTVRVSNPNLFDPMFVDALTYYLAARLAGPLTGDKQHAMSLFQHAAAMTREAAGMNGNEGPTIIDQTPDWIRVRGILSDWAQMPGAGWFVDPFPLTLVI